MRFRRLRARVPRTATARLTEALLGQLGAVAEGVALATAMASGERSRGTARRRMAEIEHRGDAGRADLVTVLGRSLAAPIDREDLFRLSRSVDDVLDTLRDFVRESDLYRVSTQEAFVPLLNGLGEGVEALRAAVGALPSDPRAAADHALRARKIAGGVDRAQQYLLADLVDGRITADILKRRELTRRLALAAARLGESCDVLADAVFKRGH
ncbi:hypothetical protein CLV63_10340 [Murinocardiopsis flavida]|uniref:DUF47 family protein n=1 Tax=Murinocardiopsis flavida TaxID=645275 RepID=A0A2P8DQ16_9ACTN|nr:DUF47 family protein [Murinocardiopsis flavida]PSK99319.1 hypothetical protein CLV63_10340 [Murinocardiopsis flavida]